MVSTTGDTGRRPRRVLVVTGDHSLPDPTKWDGRFAESDLELHQEMRAALETLDGTTCEFLTRHDELVDRVRRGGLDLVLNFCDTGFANAPERELHVPALLETLGIPYSGAPPAAMVLCYDKAIVRLVADSLGVPTPHETYLPAEARVDALDGPWPALIKPVEGDGSVGISRGAVVLDPVAARRQLDWFRRELPGRAALLQEFLPGREYGLALIGNRASGFSAFPPLEVDYGALPEELPRILAFESKTGPEMTYSAVRIRAAELDERTVALLRTRAELLFTRLGCRDYARFDFRTAADGEIKLLEVNPNPAWSSAGKLAQMARFAGTSYPELLSLLLETAWRRVRGGRA